MSRDEYVQLLSDLLSKDPIKIRDANQRLYTQLVTEQGAPRAANLVLAEVGA